MRKMTLLAAAVLVLTLTLVPGAQAAAGPSHTASPTAAATRDILVHVLYTCVLIRTNDKGVVISMTKVPCD